MPEKSQWQVDIPEVSLQTYVFGSAMQDISQKPILIDADRPDTTFLTLNDFRLWSKRFAVGLQGAGLKEGDRVLLFSGNNLFFPVIIMGALMAGGVFTGANPTYVARELAHQLKDSGARFLLSADSSLEVALEAAQSIGFPQQNVFIFDDEAFGKTGKVRLGVNNWRDLIASESEGNMFQWREPKDVRKSLACLNYSSGTTGVAKGVRITHYNHVANAVQSLHMATLQPDNEERQKTDVALCLLPMYHAYGQASFAVICPKRGTPVYILAKFDFVRMLECVERYKVTAFTLVPPIAVALAKSPLVKKYDLSSIRNITSGAAPLSAAICHDLEKLWPDGVVNVKQGWGMSETTCTAMMWDPNMHSDSFGVGQPSPNCEAVIMNDDEKTEVVPGERGELWVRGPNIMDGYWQNEKATTETLTKDGWLKTGDIAYRDEHGIYFIVDRRKELIKVKGLQVAPAELEAVLLEHPNVADAAVVGVTIQGEECPRAYIVLREAIATTTDQITRYMQAKVSRHKYLTGGIVFVNAIPKNPSGKLLRKELRERAVREVGDSLPRPIKL